MRDPSLAPIAASLQLDARQQAAFDAAMAQMRERVERMRAQMQAAAAAAPASGIAGASGMRGNRGGARGGNGGGAGRMAERMKQDFAEFRTTLSPAQQERWDSALASLASALFRPAHRQNNEF